MLKKAYLEITDVCNLDCSFCHKTQEQVDKLIAGPGVYICDECIDLCQSILDSEPKTSKHSGGLNLGGLPKPK